jgi:MarR family transcriptional regulator, temperature-dependent positive regulator of motility
MLARSIAHEETANADGDPVELYSMPGHLIRRLHQASQAIFDAEIAAAGIDLTSVQFAALTMIAANPGIDQARLANAIAFDRATTGGVIDRLEAKGFVRREIVKTDRRARRLHLEAAGTTTLHAATPIVRHAQSLMLKALSDKEQATLLRLMAKAVQTGLRDPATR